VPGRGLASTSLLSGSVTRDSPPPPAAGSSGQQGSCLPSVRRAWSSARQRASSEAWFGRCELRAVRTVHRHATVRRLYVSCAPARPRCSCACCADGLTLSPRTAVLRIPFVRPEEAALTLLGNLFFPGIATAVLGLLIADNSVAVIGLLQVRDLPPIGRLLRRGLALGPAAIAHPLLPPLAPPPCRARRNACSSSQPSSSASAGFGPSSTAFFCSSSRPAASAGRTTASRFSSAERSGGAKSEKLRGRRRQRPSGSLRLSQERGSRRRKRRGRRGQRSAAPGLRWPRRCPSGVERCA
jgi:hypothetical protein